MAPPKLTQQSIAILGLFLSNRDSYLCGADVMRETGFLSGTVYPILMRFERAGLLRSHWEDEAAAASEARPARRLYVLTGEGQRAARKAFLELRAFVPGLAMT